METQKIIARKNDKSQIYVEIKDLRRFKMENNIISIYDKDELMVQYEFSSISNARHMYAKISNAIKFNAKSVMIEWFVDMPEEIIKEFGLDEE